MCYEWILLGGAQGLHWCAMSGAMCRVLRWSTRYTLVCYEWSIEMEHKDNTGGL